MALIKLSKGLYSAYTALSTKDANTVYFCTDSGHLYLGTTLLVGGSVTSVTHNSDTEVITIVTQTGTGAQSTTVDLGVYLKENTPITASTGKSFVTYDTKGLVTGGTAITATDSQLVKGDGSGVNIGTGSGNIPVLNGSGKLSDSVIPSIAITDTFVVATEVAMLALTAEVGDVAIRTDLKKSFILQTSPASVLANWQELKTPTDAVNSVNGQTGTIVLGGGDLLVETASNVTNGASITTTDTIDGALGKLNTKIGAKLNKNAAITAATKTKITYDVNGLVTAGVDASAVDFLISGYSKATDPNSPLGSTDTVLSAFGKLEKTLDSVKGTADGAVQSVTSGTPNTINIGGTATDPTVSLIKLPPIQVNSEDRYKYINHRLGRKPDVQLIDDSGEIRYVQVIHLSDDSLQLSWVGSIAGSIIIE